MEARESNQTFLRRRGPSAAKVAGVFTVLVLIGMAVPKSDSSPASVPFWEALAWSPAIFAGWLWLVLMYFFFVEARVQAVGRRRDADPDGADEIPPL